MTKIILNPTLPLTDFAQLHWKEMRFGSQEPLGPRQKSIEISTPTWLGRQVDKIYHTKSKVVSIANTIIRLILALSIIGIPLVILWHLKERKLVQDSLNQQKAIAKLNRHNERLNQRANLIEKLSLTVFNKLPQLDLKGRMGPTGYIDILLPNDLSTPLMKGIDKFGRAFITCKLIDTSSQNPSPFVATYFERYTNNSFWVWGGCNNYPAYTDIWDLHSEQAQDFFGKIAAGQHPKYKLA